jgi:hypothetical protein
LIFQPILSKAPNIRLALVAGQTLRLRQTKY